MAPRQGARPLEHAPLSDAQLEAEHQDTAAFLKKALKRDPRAPPSADYEVKTDHLGACLGCANHNRALASLHEYSELHIGSELQLLVDDYPLFRWRNAMRFLNPPASQEIALNATPAGVEHARFGCPCSAVAAPEGGVSLWTAGWLGEGTTTPHPRRPAEMRSPTPDEHSIVMRHSYDGRSGWSKPRAISMRDVSAWRQFTVSAQRRSLMGQKTYIAGYEGYFGQACLAYSVDGLKWSPIRAGSALDKKLLPYHKASERSCPHPMAESTAPSMHGRAADTSVTPVYDPRRRREMLWYRKDFGTSFGWREIRGVQVSRLNTPMDALPKARPQTVSNEVLATWYLDRLGKTERFRRQIYSLALSPYSLTNKFGRAVDASSANSSTLWIGLATVVEWAKDDVTEAVGEDLPAFTRDTLNVYLVTSRDGVSVDDGWIYAHRPLLRKGALQRDWDAGLHVPAPQIVSNSVGHRVYFESRRAHHEQRFTVDAVIGVAHWPRDRIVGLRQAHVAQPAEVVTKVLRIEGRALLLGVDVGLNGSVTVEVLTPEETPLLTSLPVTAPGGDSTHTAEGGVEVRWAANEIADIAKRAVRLRFVLKGGARLYSFQVRQ